MKSNAVWTIIPFLSVGPAEPALSHEPGIMAEASVHFLHIRSICEKWLLCESGSVLLYSKFSVPAPTFSITAPDFHISPLT